MPICLVNHSICIMWSRKCLVKAWSPFLNVFWLVVRGFVYYILYSVCVRLRESRRRKQIEGISSSKCRMSLVTTCIETAVTRWNHTIHWKDLHLCYNLLWKNYWVVYCYLLQNNMLKGRFCTFGRNFNEISCSLWLPPN